MVLPPINRSQRIYYTPQQHNTTRTTRPTKGRSGILQSSQSYYYVQRNNRNYSRRMGELPAIGDRYSKPKVLLFYKNGDRNFRGYHVTVTPRRFKNFDNLLSELTRVTNLPQGARFIFTPESGKRVVSLDELSDGKSYVCGSHPKLKKINYGCAPDGSKRKITSVRNFIPAHSNAKLEIDEKPPTNIKPKIITVIRNGYNRPRKCVKILLNKRTAQSYEQVLNDITSAVGVDGGSGVRKLFNVDSKPVLSLAELFGNDDVFVAVGSEKFKTSDMEVILEDLGINKESMRNKPGSRTLAITSPLPTRSSLKGHKKSMIKTKKRSFVSESDVQSNASIKKQPSIASMKKQPLPGIKTSNKDFSRNSTEDIKSENSTNTNSLKPPSSPLADESFEHVILDEPISDTDENNNETVADPAIDDDKMSMSSKSTTKNETINNDSPRSSDKSNIEENNDTEKDSSSENESDPEKVIDPEKDSNAEKGSDSENDIEDSDSDSSLSDTVSVHNTINSTTEVPPKRVEPSAPLLSPEPLKEKETIETIEKKSGVFETSSEINDMYEVSDKLGDGNFAVVKIGTEKSSGKKYAIKIIDAAKIEGKEALLKNEIKIQRDCLHPNIVQLYHDYRSPSEIFLVMELVTGGDFFDLIATNISFEEEEAVCYVRDLCSALDYLHQRNIVHRDIKPENLMVCENSSGQRSIKLADFGLAMKVIQPIFTICGTPTYVSPEILMEKGYGLEVDMWAAGVIMYIMLCGFPPFRSPNRKQTELFDLIEAGEFEYLQPYWDDVSDLAKDLISKILVVDVSKRIKASEVFQHPWLLKYNLTRNNTLIKNDSNNNKNSDVKGSNIGRFKAVATGVHAIQRMKLLLDSKIDRNEHFITHVPLHHNTTDSES